MTIVKVLWEQRISELSELLFHSKSRMAGPAKDKQRKSVKEHVTLIDFSKVGGSLFPFLQEPRRALLSLEEVSFRGFSIGTRKVVINDAGESFHGSLQGTQHGAHIYIHTSKRRDRHGP